MIEWIPIIIIVAITGIYLVSGFKTIRPTHLGAVETFGKYKGFRKAGLTYVFPFIQRLVRINITERLADVRRQEVITLDDLKCNVEEKRNE